MGSDIDKFLLKGTDNNKFEADTNKLEADNDKTKLPLISTTWWTSATIEQIMV